MLIQWVVVVKIPIYNFIEPKALPSGKNIFLVILSYFVTIGIFEDICVTMLQLSYFFFNIFNTFSKFQSMFDGHCQVHYSIASLAYHFINLPCFQVTCSWTEQNRLKNIMQLTYAVHASVTFTINMQSVNIYVQVLISQINQGAGKVLYWPYFSFTYYLWCHCFIHTVASMHGALCHNQQVLLECCLVFRFVRSYHSLCSSSVLCITCMTSFSMLE